MREEISIYFENPATDPLGHESVEGKLFCHREGVSLRFKQKDRAFRKNDSIVIQLDYTEVESIDYSARFFGTKILTLRTRGTDKLKNFPGAEVEKVKLHVVRGSRDVAKKAANFVGYRQSEAFLKEQDDRLSEARGDTI